MTSAAVLSEELGRLELDLSLSVFEQLRVYLDELERWNRSMNLTSLSGAPLVRRLVAEPIWIGQELQLAGKLMDIGSGNGSPAIPLSVTCSFEAVHLVEARAKRAAFLRHVVAKLGLSQVAVEESRAEEVPEPQEALTWLTLQAVRFSSLATVVQHLCKPTTKVAWITSGASSPAEGSVKVRVPGGKTEVWVFTVDQFCPPRS